MSERSGELRRQCANYALPSLPTYPSLPEENYYSPSTPSERSSTREPRSEVDGWPTLTMVRAMLRQLDADRERSGYWRSRWAEDHSDQAIETWLRSLLDWLEGAPQPVDSAGPSGPVEGRAVAEIRADLATCEQLAIVPWPAAARRLLADVPALLAEVEAAHRFEQAAAVEREALLAEVERLREQNDGLYQATLIVGAERDSLRGVVQAVEALRDRLRDGKPLFLTHSNIASQLDAALAAAADAPQPEPCGVEWVGCYAADLHYSCAEPKGHVGSHRAGPSPAVLPEKEQQR